MAMIRRNRRQSGSALIEFTLVGIPLMFVLISTFEMARGMWTYHTLAYAVREATRFTVVHGFNCSQLPNQCQVTVQRIAQEIQDAGVGLMPDQLEVRLLLFPAGQPVNQANLGNLANGKMGTLTALLADTSLWPVGNLSARPNDVVIAARYPFTSALAFFWPGTGAPIVPGAIQFRAVSREKIQF